MKKMLTSVKGLIIKETNVGEGDKILTVLAGGLGKIQAAANGARSYKSRLIAGCQLFCYTDFVLSKKKDWFRVTGAEPVEAFYPLRQSLEKLSLAAYFCDLLCEVTADAHGADEALRLALGAFYILTKEDELTRIKAAFELRLLSLSGFMPQLSSCGSCGSGEVTGFSVSDASGLCDACAGAKRLLPGTLAAMRYITCAPQDAVFAFRTDAAVTAELASVAENYTLGQIGRDFRSLKYYLTITKNMV